MKTAIKDLVRTIHCKDSIGRLDTSAVSDDVVESVLGKLNDEAREDGVAYSDDQVTRALWQLLMNRIDETIEELELEFWDQDTNRDRLLGKPEFNLKIEQAWEYADMKYNELKGK